ncbi:MAG: hypothetical protein JSV47_07285 [Deltaproteobacteria bacterium]|nr:MAG: hypothetical protein JSV47_07285 [Deltaproteobacteria bacterium]
MSETANPPGAEEKVIKKSKVQQIQDLPVPEKIELAKTGSREERLILLRDSNKQVREAVLDNSRITEVEIAAIASSPNVPNELVDKIIANLDWMKNYQVMLALVNNPRTPPSLALKLVDRLRHKDLKQLAESKKLSEELVAAAKRSAAKLEAGRPDPSLEKKPTEEKKTKSRYQEIKDMSVPEKIQLAMAGDKEARNILIKDTNKQVQEAVLSSPRITEMEIAAVANSRNVGDDMLRKISMNREWMKNYQVRVALVNNPKTPLTIGLKIVGTLMMTDLKRLAKSKGVSNVLVGAAQRILIKKGHK